MLSNIDELNKHGLSEGKEVRIGTQRLAFIPKEASWAAGALSEFWSCKECVPTESMLCAVAQALTLVCRLLSATAEEPFIGKGDK